MTYQPEWKRKADGPLEDLLKPPTAKEAPKRLRYANGSGELLSHEEARRGITQSAVQNIRWAKK